MLIQICFYSLHNTVDVISEINDQQPVRKGR